MLPTPSQWLAHASIPTPVGHSPAQLLTSRLEPPEPDDPPITPLHCLPSRPVCALVGPYLSDGAPGYRPPHEARLTRLHHCRSLRTHPLSPPFTLHLRSALQVPGGAVLFRINLYNYLQGRRRLSSSSPASSSFSLSSLLPSVWLRRQLLQSPDALPLGGQISLTDLPAGAGYAVSVLSPEAPIQDLSVQVRGNVSMFDARVQVEGGLQRVQARGGMQATQPWGEDARASL